MLCIRINEAGDPSLAKEIAEKHPVTEDATSKDPANEITEECTDKDANTTNSSNNKATEATTPCEEATPNTKYPS